MGELKRLVPRGNLRSPERAALAAAIERSHQHGSEVAEARAAEERAAAGVVQAEAAHRAAEAALQTAKAAEAAALTQQAQTGAGAVPAKSLRDFRADLLDAADSLETATTVHTTLRARRQEAEHSGVGRYALQNAVAEVMRPAALALLSEVEALQRQLVRKRIALRVAAEGGLLASDYETRVRVNAILVRVMLPGVDPNYGTHGENGWPADWDAGADREWTVLREALMLDPDAPLPIGGV